jgi:hypothetical protein
LVNYVFASLQRAAVGETFASLFPSEIMRRGARARQPHFVFPTFVATKIYEEPFFCAQFSFSAIADQIIVE